MPSALETLRLALAIEQSTVGGARDRGRAGTGRRACLSRGTCARWVSSGRGRRTSSATTKVPPGDGQVRLDLLYTGFSAGTELTFVKNTNPYLHFALGWGAGRVRGRRRRARIIRCRSSATWSAPSVSAEPGRQISPPGDVVGTTFGHKTGHTADPFRE